MYVCTYVRTYVIHTYMGYILSMQCYGVSCMGMHTYVRMYLHVQCESILHHVRIYIRMYICIHSVFHI